METTFEKTTFAKRLKSMLKVDFKRMFTMPLVYIMAAVCFALPILILVMTSMTGVEADPVTGTAAGGFTNVWQSIGSASGGAMGMDMTSMCNINMLYFLVAVLVCCFVADDFKSGYAKNLFTVRSKKVDYVFSKSLVTFTGATIMFVMYFIGAMIGGAIAGLPFGAGAVGSSAGGVVACLFSKIFLTAIFVGIGVLLSVVGKQRLWFSILGSFVVGILLFTMIPMISPLNSTIINVVICLAGGAIFAVGLGAISNVILNKTSLV